MTTKLEYTVLRLQECEHVDPETPLVIIQGVDAELARELYHTDPAYVALGGRICLRKERLTPDEAKAVRQGINVQRSIQYERAVSIWGDFEAKFTRDDDGVWHTEIVGKADASGGMTDDGLKELSALVQAAKHDEYALWRVMNIMAENAEWLLDKVMQAR